MGQDAVYIALTLYLEQDSSRDLNKVLDLTANRIDGFESPLGMELLATVDWLIQKENRSPTVEDIRQGLHTSILGPPVSLRCGRAQTPAFQ